MNFVKARKSFENVCNIIIYWACRSDITQFTVFNNILMGEFIILRCAAAIRSCRSICRPNVEVLDNKKIMQHTHCVQAATKNWLHYILVNTYLLWQHFSHINRVFVHVTRARYVMDRYRFTCVIVRVSGQTILSWLFTLYGVRNTKTVAFHCDIDQVVHRNNCSILTLNFLFL